MIKPGEVRAFRVGKESHIGTVHSIFVPVGFAMVEDADGAMGPIPLCHIGKLLSELTTVDIRMSLRISSFFYELDYSRLPGKRRGVSKVTLRELGMLRLELKRRNEPEYSPEDPALDFIELERKGPQ